MTVPQTDRPIWIAIDDPSGIVRLRVFHPNGTVVNVPLTRYDAMALAVTMEKYLPTSGRTSP